MNTNNEKTKSQDYFIDLLNTNVKSMAYIPFPDGMEAAYIVGNRGKSQFDQLLITLVSSDAESGKLGNFGNIRIYDEDLETLWNNTRIKLIMEKIHEFGLYYVFFRAFINGKIRNFKIKFIADTHAGELKGILAALIDTGVEEKIMRRKEQDLYQLLDEAEQVIAEKTAELRDRTLALSTTNEEIIDLLGNLVERRNLESGLHIKRVKLFTRVLAEQMMADYPEYKLTPELVNMIVSASSLHDVGKIMIPDSILQKPARLTAEEILEMRKHCEIGVDILRAAPKSWTAQYTKTALDICGCHHEKWDGNGYPAGLKGDQIPISAQIVSVADCYDALTSERVYKPPYSPDKAYNMILNGECGVFSDKLMSSLKKCGARFSEIAKNPDDFQDKGMVQLTGVNKLNGLHILLVDDSEMSLEINQDILESEGAIVTTASDGTIAVDIFAGGANFDAIIIDIVMPVMGGIEASRKIRELEHNVGQRTPIIALSAESVTQSALLEVGIDASMAKPLVVGELTRILISCMQNSSMQMQKQLQETINIANTDALTKLKNVAAYFDMQASINSEIKSANKPKFAIVMCDINNLKEANDRYGHETGNVYIKNCSKLLNEVFAQSPIYRVGGDEFTVVLQGENYENRYSLLERLRKRIKEAEKIEYFVDGRASLAIGMADYDPKSDSLMRNVQERADAAMYADKLNKKARTVG